MATEQVGSERQDEIAKFVANIAGGDLFKVEETLDEGYVRLKVTEAERRQAKHDIRSVEDIIIELLRNSRDAGAKKIFLASAKEKNEVRKVVIIDDGGGIPPTYHDKVFEPRVTSRLDAVIVDRYGVHGRGMALFSVKEAVDKVKVVLSFPNRGSVFKVESNTRNLTERKDQSTFPQIRMRSGKPQAVKGPRNIHRLLVEFSLEYPQIDIYFGSPAEVLATMYCLAKEDKPRDNKSSEAQVTAETFRNCLLYENKPVWQLPALINDGKALAKIAKRYYGLAISERNAHRVLNREIKSVPSVLDWLASRPLDKIRLVKKDRTQDSKSLSKYIGDNDLEEVSSYLQQLFEKIGKRYFLRLQSSPKIRRDKNRLKIELTLEKDEEY